MVRGLRTFFGFPLTIRTSTSGSSFTVRGNSKKSYSCGNLQWKRHGTVTSFFSDLIKHNTSCMRLLSHTHLFLQIMKWTCTGQFVQRSCSTKIATAATTRNFKEIPPALWTYNFGQSVPQPGRKTEIYRCFSCSLETRLYTSLPVCAVILPSNVFIVLINKRP